MAGLPPPRTRYEYRGRGFAGHYKAWDIFREPYQSGGGATERDADRLLRPTAD